MDSSIYRDGWWFSFSKHRILHHHFPPCLPMCYLGKSSHCFNRRVVCWSHENSDVDPNHHYTSLTSDVGWFTGTRLNHQVAFKIIQSKSTINPLLMPISTMNPLSMPCKSLKIHYESTKSTDFSVNFQAFCSARYSRRTAAARARLGTTSRFKRRKRCTSVARGASYRWGMDHDGSTKCPKWVKNFRGRSLGIPSRHHQLAIVIMGHQPTNVITK